MSPRRWVWLVPALLAAVLVTVLMGAFAARLVYPYDLEWMEGGMLTHGWRVQRGLPLYPAPSPDWVPFIYPPGYPALLAVVGPSHAAGRALSLAGTALAAIAAAWIVGRHGRGSHSWHAGILTAAVLVGTWDAGGTFLDLVRPDAVGLGLLLASLALGLERRPAAQILGGVLLAAAFLVKHHAAAWGLPIALGLWVRDGDPKAALRFGLAALVPAAAALGIAQLTMGGHLLTYLVAVPASHRILPVRAFPGVAWELANALPVAIAAIGAWATWAAARVLPPRLGVIVAAGMLGVAAVLAVVFTLATPGVLEGLVGVPNRNGSVVAGPFVASLGVAGVALAVQAPLVVLVARLRGRPVDPNWALIAAVGATTLLVVAWMRGHVGGFVNVNIPLFAMAAIGLGLAASDIASRPWLRGWLGPALAATVLAAQLGGQLWATDAAKRTPTRDDRMVGDSIVAQLAQMEGPVWSPVSPWLAVQAGHDPAPHLMAVWDVANHQRGPWPDTRAEFERAVADGRWQVIVDNQRGIEFGVPQHTRTVWRVPGNPRAFRPRAGWRDRPAVVRQYTPD